MTESNKLIMLVDDDVDFLRQMELQLKAVGFDVKTAEGADAAMALVEQGRPDLAVVDLMMSELDEGFTLCHRLKRKDKTIPIIMVTAVTAETGMAFDASTQEERSWVKADALLAKPVRFEQLRREIDRLLEA